MSNQQFKIEVLPYGNKWSSSDFFGNSISHQLIRMRVVVNGKVLGLAESAEEVDAMLSKEANKVLEGEYGWRYFFFDDFVVERSFRFVMSPEQNFRVSLTYPAWVQCLNQQDFEKLDEMVENSICPKIKKFNELFGNGQQPTLKEDAQIFANFVVITNPRSGHKTFGINTGEEVSVEA